MLKTEEYAALLPQVLLSQIEELLLLFQQMHGEAAAIIHHGNVPDASAQLADVLQATEKATHTIIDSVSAIDALASAGAASAEDKQQITSLVTQVYEACNFQDVTGQRIKKVLVNLGDIERRLTRLTETARAYVPEGKQVQSTPTKIVLENGPQLTNEAPDQQAVDDLFKSL